MWQVERGIFLLAPLWKVWGTSRVSPVIGVAMAIKTLFLSNFNPFNTSLSTVRGEVWKHKAFLIGNKWRPTHTQPCVRWKSTCTCTCNNGVSMFDEKTAGHSPNEKSARWELIVHRHVNHHVAGVSRSADKPSTSESISSHPSIS